MDPFTYFPSEIGDSILQHLTGNEILEATKVSKTWNSFIGASSKSMQKVEVCLYWLRGKRYVLNPSTEILIESNRRYQNISIKFQSQYLDDFQMIMEPKCRNWKVVSLERIRFKMAMNLMDMLKTCRGTVEDLELDCIYAKNAIGLETFDFPKLKILNLSNSEISRSTVNKIFLNCKNLEKLEFMSDDTSESSTDAMKIILKNNRKLKHLEVSSNQVNHLFVEDMSFDFKLETFSSNCHNESAPIPNYKHIITHQFDSLKDLSFVSIDCPEMMKLIFKVPNLKNLTIDVVRTSTLILSNNLLSINKSIEKLTYQDYDKSFDFMQCLVDAAPNLKRVQMFSLTQNMMEYMSANLKHLEELKLRTLDATDLSSTELFPNLKKVQVDIVISALEDHIVSIPVDACNPLVAILKLTNYLVLN